MCSTISGRLATLGFILEFAVPVILFARQSANSHSYVDEPIEKLMTSIPELKTLRPVTDQRELPMILAKAGDKVDECFGSLVAVVARETITEQRLEHGDARKPEMLAQYQWDYIIRRDTTKYPAMVDEYRVEDNGEILSPYLPFVHYFFTGAFAASILYLSKELQPESVYRYLGEQMIGTTRSYVLAFAQVSGATHTLKLSLNTLPTVNARLHGIVWIDEDKFQILQTRTDVLDSVGGDENSSGIKISTVVVFRDVKPVGVAQTMRLPISARVYADVLPMVIFQNDHQFADYRRFGGSKPGQDTDAEEKEQQKEQQTKQAHPYLEKPLSELTQRLPQLKGTHPAIDQQQLPMILQKTGSTVDQFLAHLVDVIADEEITEERLTPVPAKERLRDSYLVVRRSQTDGASFHEFRMDAQGNRIAEERSDKGFFATTGFALSTVHFSTANQWDSRFLFLGDEKVDGRDVYVVAFAQLPGQARNTVTLKGENGIAVQMLTQGIAWVNKTNFHIVRMRTDLLSPYPEVGLDQLTTEIEFSDALFADVAAPLWLPSTVDVHIKSTPTGPGTSSRFTTRSNGGDIFRNVHHYTNYRRYQVGTKIITPQ